MVHLLAAILFGYLGAVEAATTPEKYLGLEPLEGQYCDASLIETIKVELAYSICLGTGDPSCLYEFFREKVKSKTKFDQLYMKYSTYSNTPRSSSVKQSQRELSESLKESSSPGELSKYRAITKKVLESWLSIEGDKNFELRSHYLKRLESQQNTGYIIHYRKLAEGLFGWIPIVGDFVSSGNNLIDAFESQAAIQGVVDTSCPLTRIDVPSQMMGSDCVPLLHPNTQVVRHMLRQPPGIIEEKLKNPSTCSFYYTLAAHLKLQNKSVESYYMSPLSGEPTCLGNRSVSFSPKAMTPYVSNLPADKLKKRLNQRDDQALDTPRTMGTMEVVPHDLTYQTIAHLDTSKGQSPKIRTEINGPVAQLEFSQEYTKVHNGFLKERLREGNVNMEGMGGIHKDVADRNAFSAARAAACCEQANAGSCFTDNFVIMPPAWTFNPAPASSAPNSSKSKR